MEMSEARQTFNDLPDVDMTIIDDKPWAKTMWEALQQGLKKSYLNWCNAVISLCDDENDIKGWMSTYMEHFEDTCCLMVVDVEKLKTRVIEQTEEQLAKLQNLCAALQVTMPVIGRRKATYYQELKHIKELNEEYEVIVKARTKEVSQLKQKQLDLCKILGKEPLILKDFPLPSPEALDEFRLHLEKLETEVFNRVERFLTFKEKILVVYKELQLIPSTQFEREVLSPNNDDFLVTDENMTLLVQLHNSLQHQQESIKEEITSLRNKVDEYWNLLDVDMLDRASFRDRHAGYSVEVLNALRQEVRRCEELKKANIKVFVDKIRKELEQVWHKCQCSQVQKGEFGFFYSDCYTEDLLELHEVELNKWNRYFEKNKELLELLEKHKSAWNKMLELEANATGPNRYKNRGGHLLKEEKERNKLAKQIPQMEEYILMLSKKYEEHHGVPFTTFGETVQSYLFHLQSEREKNKQEKLSARKIKKEQTLITPIKSALSLFPSTSTTNLRTATPYTVKRKQPTTPLTDDKKKPKLTPRLVLGPLTDEKRRLKLTPCIVLNKKSPPKIKITTTASRSKRLSNERKKRIDKIRRLSAQKANSRAHDTAASTDYEEFHTLLSNRDDCRSTINPLAMPLPKTPTPSTPRRPRTDSNSPSPSPATNNNTKLTLVKSPFKLIF